ncbi:putative orfan [Tupanvirus soda lake]|uniref:Orfan n=2 Tax=Tupanvirus TaxID=2094720 RepID=A0AC62AC72_9VIRU|nr:putative orfan [Tupanvirus soda lake]QKU35392.1 putative orfan [Tupanvirus soda lake]
MSFLNIPSDESSSSLSSNSKFLTILVGCLVFLLTVKFFMCLDGSNGSLKMTAELLAGDVCSSLGLSELVLTVSNIFFGLRPLLFGTVTGFGLFFKVFEPEKGFEFLTMTSAVLFLFAEFLLFLLKKSIFLFMTTR